jgi:ubiquinone/menaquinone biosynthesis C-methylase UbiE
VVEFDTCEALADKMRAAGLVNVRFKRLTMGIAAIHVGDAPL